MTDPVSTIGDTGTYGFATGSQAIAASSKGDCLNEKPKPLVVEAMATGPSCTPDEFHYR
ncbi:MAG: hypothetical protein VKL98_00955 [Cyanobacteriota bacterium]|nr:hypothetical protein [Cyanobacteriota bacterium]